jgi:hypothetical protein
MAGEKRKRSRPTGRAAVTREKSLLQAPGGLGAMRARGWAGEIATGVGRVQCGEGGCPEYPLPVIAIGRPGAGREGVTVGVIDLSTRENFR